MSRVIGRGRYATETYPEGQRAGGGPPAAPLEPILIELWVGVMTTPPATPNGSIEAPFPTLQAAFDFVTALPAGANTKVTYLLNSGPEPAVSTTPSAGHHNIIGLDERTDMGTLIVTPAEGGTLTLSTRNLAGNIFVSGATTGHIFLTITNDAAGVGGLQAADISLGEDGDWGGTIDLVWVNGFVQGCISRGTRARFYDCQIPNQGAVVCLAIDTCANCDIGSNNTIQVTDVPNGLGFVGCNFHDGPTQFDGPPGCVVLDPQSGLTFSTATLLTSGASTNLAADVGDVLTVVAPGLPRWMPAGAGSALLPIHYQFWVGVLDTPPGTPNGSIQAPFLDLDTALVVGNALPDDVIVDYFVADDTYALTEHIGANKHTRIISMCGGTTLTGSVIIDCAIGNTTLSLFDVSAPDGIAPTTVAGGGNCNVKLYSPTDTSVVASISDAALLAGNLTIIASGGRINNILAPNRCTSISTDGTDLGTTDGGLCEFSFIDGNIESDTSVGVITSTPGILDAVIGSPSPEVTITFTVAAANQAVCIRSTTFRTGGTFNGPAASFSADIDSAESFSHLWGLAGGATTNFTAEGAEGKVLTVSGGFPQWETSASAPLLPIHYQFWIGTLDVAPGAPNGSIQAPFLTLQDALTAGAALPPGSTIDYFLADSDYSGEGPIAVPSGKTTRLVSMRGDSLVGAAAISAEDPSTVFALYDVRITDGVTITGAVGGDVLLKLFYSEPETAGIGALVETLPAGQLSIQATNGAIQSINAPRCNLIESSGTNYPGVINTPNCDFRASDGDIGNDVTVFTYGCVDCVIGGDSETGVQWTVGAVTPGSVLGFNSCQFNGFGDFSGPVGSFTTDIDSAYAAQVAAWSLSGGATTVFTDRGNVGQVLTVNVNGLPAWATGSTAPTEISDYIPVPEWGFGTQIVRARTTTFSGASYIARRPLSLDEIGYMIDAALGADYIIAIYQAPGGGSGIANLVGKVTKAGVTDGAPTVHFDNFDSQPCVLEEGLFYCLLGSVNGTQLDTMMYTNVSVALLNGPGTLSTQHPTTFTTTLPASSGAPPTFNPVETGSGGDATANPGNHALIIRLLS